MNLKIALDAEIDADKLVTGRTCIIGQSGSGKSYAVAVLCEELAKNNIGFCIIDTEGEYFSLKEKYPVLLIGESKESEVHISETDINKIATTLLKKNFPAIFDVSDLDNPKEKVGELLQALYNTATKLKQPYLVIIEEIDKFAPQRGEVLREVEEISRRGRKRGLGLLIATQRPALVSKNILSQCGNQIIGKLTINNDIDAVKVFFPDKKNIEKLPQLKPGEFFIQGDISSPKLVKIRKRETQHKAITPKLMGDRIIHTKDLEQIESELKGVSASKEIESDVEEISTFGIKPVLSTEEAFAKIKKGTKVLKLFGKGSTISSLHMVLRPIYKCELKHFVKKLFGHEFFTANTYFDGITGDIISIDKGFFIKFKLNEFIGLETNELEVFNAIARTKGTTTLEIAQKLSRSPESIRLSIKELAKRNLARDKRKGRSVIYYAFTKARLPQIKQISYKPVEINRINAIAKKQDFKISPEELGAFVRSLGEKADIISEKKFYYPFYKAIVIQKDKSKEIVIDAVTGKTIRLNEQSQKK